RRRHQRFSTRSPTPRPKPPRRRSRQCDAMMNRRWAEMTVSDRSDTRDDRSVAELVTQISDQTSHLVRDEMRLARAEMTETAKHTGAGLGLFGGAGMLAH